MPNMRRYRTPKPDLSDGIVAYIKKTYIAIGAFLILVVYFGHSILQYSELFSGRMQFQDMLVLRSLTTAGWSPSTKQATVRDVVANLSGARGRTLDKIDALGAAAQELASTALAEQIEKVMKEPVPNSTILEIPVYLEPTGACKIIAIGLDPGASYSVGAKYLGYGGELTSRFVEVRSEDVTIFQSPMCGFSPVDVLMFSSVDQGVFLAVRQPISRALVGREEELAPATLDLIENQIPQVLRGLVGFRSFDRADPADRFSFKKDRPKYSVVELRQVESELFRFMQQALEKRVSKAEFEAGVRELYALSMTKASYLGITAGADFFVRAGPIVLSFLLFGLWRAVRRLPEVIHSPTYWFAFETRDTVGRIHAYFLATFPLISVGTVFGVFLFTQDMWPASDTWRTVVARLFGYYWRSQSWQLGDILGGLDWYVGFVWVTLFPMALAFASLACVRLVVIVRRNVRSR